MIKQMLKFALLLLSFGIFPLIELKAQPVPTGIWEGTLDQKNFGSYPMVLTIDKLNKGERAGSTQYPTLSCGGTLTFIEIKDNWHILKEKVQGKSCVDGYIRFKVNDKDSLYLEWFRNTNNIEASGLLNMKTKSSVVGQHGQGQEQADDSCREANEVAHKFAASLTASAVGASGYHHWGILSKTPQLQLSYSIMTAEEFRGPYPYPSGSPGHTIGEAREVKYPNTAALLIQHLYGNGSQCYVLIYPEAAHAWKAAALTPAQATALKSGRDIGAVTPLVSEAERRAPRPSGQEAAPEGSLPANTAPPTNEGARQVAWNLYSQRIRECGQSWFATAKHMGQPLLVEIKDLGFRADAIPLTDVDKANGIQWKGKARIGGKMFRYWNQSGKAEPWEAWDDVHIPDTDLALVRTQQQWLYEFATTSISATKDGFPKTGRNQSSPFGSSMNSHLLAGGQCPAISGTP